MFSPASIYLALSIVHHAACGNTDAQLTDFFAGKASIENIASLLNSLRDNGLVKVSNTCCISDKLVDSIDQETVANVRSIASILTENFDDTEALRKKLNALISDATNGLINGTIRDIDKRSLMIIVNTVYFKAKWRHKFDPDKTDTSATFYSAVDQRTSRVKMMAMKETKSIPYFENDLLQLIELQYLMPSSTANSDFVMGIVLPNYRNQRFIPSDELQQYIAELKTDKVEVKIPKFTLRKRVDLIPVLRRLGVSDLFSRTDCDLSKLFGSNKAFVNDIIHEAVIIVDEVGTEAAAAATVVSFVRKRKLEARYHKIFVADHSFVFYIRHLPTSSFVFMGEYHGEN